jgi:hypothetical protein
MPVSPGGKRIYFLEIIFRISGGSWQTWYNGADVNPEIMIHFIRRKK